MQRLWLILSFLFLFLFSSCKVDFRDVGGTGNGEPYPGTSPNDSPPDEDGIPRYGFITNKFVQEQGKLLDFHSYLGSETCEDDHGLIHLRIDHFSLKPEVLYRVDNKCTETKEDFPISELKFPALETKNWWFFFHRDHFYHYSTNGLPRNDFEVAYCFADYDQEEISLNLKITYDRVTVSYQYYGVKWELENEIEFQGAIDYKKPREGQRVFEQSGFRLTIFDEKNEQTWKGVLDFADLGFDDFNLHCLIDSKHKP